MKRTQNFGEGGEKFFNGDNVKGLLSEVSVRKLNLPTFEEVYDDYMKMFEGFNKVLEISKLTNYSDLFAALEDFMKQDYNIIVRAYLGNNLFIEELYYFGKFRLRKLLTSQWKKYGFDYDDIENNKVFKVNFSKNFQK